MTAIHVQLIGDNALLPRDELERLVVLARQSDQVELEVCAEDTSTFALMRLAEQGGAFDFWKDKGENIYTVTDGEPV